MSSKPLSFFFHHLTFNFLTLVFLYTLHCFLLTFPLCSHLTFLKGTLLLSVHFILLISFFIHLLFSAPNCHCPAQLSCPMAPSNSKDQLTCQTVILRFSPIPIPNCYPQVPLPALPPTNNCHTTPWFQHVITAPVKGVSLKTFVLLFKKQQIGKDNHSLCTLLLTQAFLGKNATHLIMMSAALHNSVGKRNPQHHIL